ncbi:MAG: xanthine dehydrogenase family protein subunit M [Variibacter sp.]|nr:xanthine dehydrogenase family protein subunit M [Variibacter sp.]
MKSGPFVYHDPRTLDDLAGLLATLENAKLLAGGQSLMPMLNMRYVQPDHLVDINRIPDLSFIRETPRTIEFGAMVRQHELLDSPLVVRACPLIAEAVRNVGHFQTRNRGTFGGSLCHLDPAAELPTAATACDAVLTVRGARGERTIAMEDWALGYLTPAAEPDEVLTKISVPRVDGTVGHAFVEFARRHGDFAIVAIACLLALRDGVIASARLVAGGVDIKPMRLSAAEQLLIGQPPSAAAFAAAAAEARKIDAMSDSYVSSAYRQRLAGVLTERALKQAGARAGAATHA